MPSGEAINLQSILRFQLGVSVVWDSKRFIYVHIQKLRMRANLSVRYLSLSGCSSIVRVCFSVVEQSNFQAEIA